MFLNAFYTLTRYYTGVLLLVVKRSGFRFGYRLHALVGGGLGFVGDLDVLVSEDGNNGRGGGDNTVEGDRGMGVADSLWVRKLLTDNSLRFL